MNKYEQLQKYRENESFVAPQRSSILEFFIKILSYLLILPIIRFDYTTRQLRKHDVIKVCSIEYLTTKITLMLPTFKFWTVHKVREYLTLGLLSTFEISITVVQQLTF